VFTDVTERDRTRRADAEFVENAAHQLRNPISAIVSSIAALEAGAQLEERERERFMTHIARETARLETLVEALLTLAGIQQQQQQEQQRLALVELVPLRRLLDQLVAAAALRDGVKARVTCGTRVAVVGDRDLLAQAFGNVIANAAQHTERGVIRIRARLDGGTVTVDITDSGPGVAEDARDRVFDRFFRGSTNGGRGSGLGLAIALAAVQAHDARLELLDQREGEGARFRFTIPGARLL
jgi:two-component system phosphate regulon sensor histidine kinase PhoR